MKKSNTSLHPFRDQIVSKNLIRHLGDEDGVMAKRPTGQEVLGSNSINASPFHKSLPNNFLIVSDLLRALGGLKMSKSFYIWWLKQA